MHPCRRSLPRDGGPWTRPRSPRGPRGRPEPVEPLERVPSREQAVDHLREALPASLLLPERLVDHLADHEGLRSHCGRYSYEYTYTYLPQGRARARRWTGSEPAERGDGGCSPPCPGSTGREVPPHALGMPSGRWCVGVAEDRPWGHLGGRYFSLHRSPKAMRRNPPMVYATSTRRARVAEPVSPTNRAFRRIAPQVRGQA